MKILVSPYPGASFEERDVDKETTLEEIYNGFDSSVRHRVFAANVNNDIKAMNYKVHNVCTVQFLDITSKSAFIIYQNSLILLMLRAAVDVIGDRTVEVRMSLCDGVFIEFGDEGITEEEVEKIEERMKELVDLDLPVSRNDEDHAEYTLDGFTAKFYSHLVPRTGYLDLFKLMKYSDGLLLRYAQIENPDSIADFEDDKMMFQAFCEQSKWNELLGVRYIKDINEKVRAGECTEMIKLSEALHDKKIVDIADEITKKGKRIILILGPSSSGKTTTAKRLAIQLKVNGLNPFYVSTDDYFLERDETPRDENGEYNFEGVDAIDVELFTNNMNDLLEGKEVDVPVFDFIKGGKTFGTRMTRLNPDQPIIIEGIHSFNPALTGGIPDKEKYKIYISPLTQINIDRYNRIPTTDTRLIRRMVRDSWSRNYDAVRTLENWEKVHEGEIENIFPFTNEADVFFNTVHIYEVCVLKKYAMPMLEKITRDVPEYAEAQRLIKYLKYVEEFDDEELIGSDSILREFIGGSIYAK